jgi:hypothetical protein
MSSVIHNPRIHALGMMTLGAAAAGLVVLLGGMDVGGNKAIMAVGLASVAFGVGLVELLWPPPPPTDERDDRNFFQRASWPQKICYGLGGLVGITAAAVLQVSVSGGI